MHFLKTRNGNALRIYLLARQIMWTNDCIKCNLEKHFLIQNLKIVDFLENSLFYQEEFEELFQLVSYSRLAHI